MLAPLHTSHCLFYRLPQNFRDGSAWEFKDTSSTDPFNHCCHCSGSSAQVRMIYVLLLAHMTKLWHCHWFLRKPMSQIAIATKVRTKVSFLLKYFAGLLSFAQLVVLYIACKRMKCILGAWKKKYYLKT